MHIGIDASRAFVSKPTGTENYSYHITKSLLELKSPHTFTLYIRPGYDEERLMTFQQQFQGVKFRYVNWGRLWTQGGLAQELFKKAPEVLFVPAHTLPLLRPPQIKTVVTIHDLGAEYLPQYHTFPSKYYLNLSTEYVVKAASKLIAVSEFTKKDLVKKMSVPKEKITTIYEGIELEKFAKTYSSDQKELACKKYQLTKPFLLYVGTIQPRKNLVRLIAAFSNFKKNNPRDTTQLVLIGKLGWLYEDIIKAPKEFAIEEDVRFLHFVETSDLQALYQKAEAFILPSLFEGFGLPILEAMASKTPVLASNVTSLPEVVGDAGVLFNPEDITDIEKAVAKVLLDKKLQHKLVQKGSKRVAEFTWQKAAEKTLKLFESL